MSLHVQEYPLCTCHVPSKQNSYLLMMNGCEYNSVDVWWLQSPTFAKDESPRTVKHFQFNCWTQTGSVPTSTVPLMTLLDLVEEAQHGTGHHPVVVHCQYATFHISVALLSHLTFYDVLCLHYLSRGPWRHYVFDFSVCVCVSVFVRSFGQQHFRPAAVDIIWYAASMSVFLWILLLLLTSF